MQKTSNILTDSFNRKHTYLRISITERCNFRCTYCMPENGIQLSPKSHIMTYEEIYAIAKTFVDLGVTKIRITGGEPLIRHDFEKVLALLASLNVEISLTTNGVLLDKYCDILKKHQVKNINISIDSLNKTAFNKITRRTDFDKVYQNILKFSNDPFFNIKLNCVLTKGFNEHEIIDFINFTQNHKVAIRFIEFMPFDGNQWDMSKTVSLANILTTVNNHYNKEEVVKLQDQKNDTAKNYQIKNFKGSFAVISTVTNPFCDTCNRIRLTANGKLKNCLFSNGEVDLLTALRNQQNIKPFIKVAIQTKQKERGGMNTEQFTNNLLRNENRNMTTIGG